MGAITGEGLKLGAITGGGGLEVGAITGGAYN